MARLTKVEAKMHAEAVAVLEQDHLSDGDKGFVLQHWQESAENVNSAAGAFFTPLDYALDFALEVIQFDDRPARVLDLCAGVGSLSLATTWRHRIRPEITCVEVNPQYVRLGRRMVPEARWIETSLFNLPDDLGRFDVVISNPPFGRVKRDGGGPTYSGAEFEFHVIDVASRFGDYGVFILPQNSCPFRYSGAPYYEEVTNRKVATFREQTGIELAAGIGIDTTVYSEWHGVAVRTEVVTADFE